MCPTLKELTIQDDSSLNSPGVDNIHSSASSRAETKIRQIVAYAQFLDASVLTLSLSKQSILEYKWAGVTLQKQTSIYCSLRGRKKCSNSLLQLLLVQISYISALMKTYEDDPTPWWRTSCLGKAQQLLVICFLCSPSEIPREL